MSRRHVTPLRRIEPPPEQQEDESSYRHIPVSPAFSVQATYKSIGKMNPRQWPEDTSENSIEPWSALIDGSMYTVWQQATDTSENAEPSPEDGYEVDAAGTYTGEKK